MHEVTIKPEIYHRIPEQTTVDRVYIEKFDPKADDGRMREIRHAIEDRKFNKERMDDAL